MAEKDTKIKQLIISEENSLIFINQNNLKDMEETIDMLLQATITLIRGTIPEEFVDDFVNVYIESLKDLNEEFHKYYSKSDKSKLDVEKIIKDNHLDEIQPIDKSTKLDELFLEKLFTTLKEDNKEKSELKIIAHD